MLYKNTVDQKDENYKYFCLNKRGNQHIVEEKLDPAILKYSYPDFGYNANFHFKENDDEDTQKLVGWGRMLNCISPNPKNERLVNYINYIN